MSLVDRLHADLGSMVMFSGQELQLLAEFDPSELDESNCEYDLNFLRQIQQAADRHLAEKREIRDALGLLKIYNKSPRSRRSKTKKNLWISFFKIVIFPLKILKNSSVQSVFKNYLNCVWNDFLSFVVFFISWCVSEFNSWPAQISVLGCVGFWRGWGQF